MLKLKKWMLFSGLLLMAARAGAQVEMDFFQKSAAQTKSAAAAPNDARESELYNQGTQAMNDSKWDQAVAKFDDAAKLRGRRAEGALYWKAFSQSKLGNQSGALATCADLRKTYPQSRWLKECGALEIELRGGNRATASSNDAGEDEDLKLLALNQLMDRDEERAMPLIERFLNGTHSDRLKERALFVLAQSQSPKAQQIIGDIARGKSHPELQAKAVQYIGIHGGKQGLDTLAQIYSTTNSVPVKRQILQAYGISDDRTHLLAAARTETDRDLQRAAVQGLGVAGAKQELRQLYKDAKSADLKSNILDAMIVDGDDEYFAEAARTEPDLNLRRKAIRGIGISGGRDSGPALVAIYRQYQDRETKDAAIEGLFISDNAKALVELARQEKDRDMRRRIVEKLSVMDDKEARDYMLEILER